MENEDDAKELQKLKEQLATILPVMAAIESNRGIVWLPLKWAMRFLIGRTIRDVQRRVDILEGTLVVIPGKTMRIGFRCRKP